MIELSLDVPFVILIDLDHTIQGDIEPQLEESNLHNLINSHNTNAPKTKVDKQLIKKDFIRGLLRPGFKHFVKRMKDLFPNVEFFVYTASNTDWGKYIVKQIESVIGIHFNKRVFTRSDCLLDPNPMRNTYYKSIKKVSPDIFTCLKAKYKLVGPKQTYVFKHILLIDNNEVLRNEERRHLVKCPSYTFKVVINPFRSISDKTIRQNFKVISTFLLQRESRNVFQMYAHVYAMLELRYLKAATHNYKVDTYWEMQYKIFKRDYRVV